MFLPIQVHRGTRLLNFFAISLQSYDYHILSIFFKKKGNIKGVLSDSIPFFLATRFFGSCIPLSH